MLRDVMYYYNHGPVEIILKAEDQAPFIERQKANGDSFSAGNMSEELYVKMTYGNSLTKEEQDREIAYLKATKAQRDAQQEAMKNSWNK